MKKTKKIKIFHLIKSLGRGGAEMLLPETLALHDREQFEFCYAYFVDYMDQMVPVLEAQNVEVHCFKANWPGRILWKSIEVARFAKRWGADLIHCHLPLAGVSGRIAGKLCGIPVLYTEHNKLERYHPLTRRANLLTMHWNERVLAVSQDVASSLRSHLNGREVNVATLLNGVNTENFSRTHYNKRELKQAFGLPPKSLVVGSVAVFRVQKRLHLWLEYAAQLHKQFPHCRFVLVGDGPCFANLKEQALQLGLQDRILFPGRLEDVRPWLAIMDIFLMTSEFEGLPVALLEAMSMECAVVATRAGGTGEVIRPGIDGFLVPVEQPGELLPKLFELAENEALRKQMGEHARQRVRERFSIERMARELEEVYREVGKRTGKRPGKV